MQLHRVARNPYGRAVYDHLQAAGVTATWMSEFVRSLDRCRPAVPACPYDVRPCDPARVESLDAPTDELVDGETIIGAFADGTPAGYLFLSVDEAIDIHPLEREMTFEGGYVRRVFVSPEHRQQGVAQSLLERACCEASDRNAGRISALVARDNVPSRALFDSLDFRVVREHRYVRVGPLSHSATIDR